LNNVLSRRRAPVIVRRADAARPDRRRRGSRSVRFGPPTRASVIATVVLLLATFAWLSTFAYLVIVVH
jgi:hypothetical protein